MPVPRLYEAFSEPREQWTHVLATLLQLGGSETRAALVAELLGDPIDGTGQMLVSERRVVGTGPEAVTLDITLRSGEDWVIGIISDVAFDVDRARGDRRRPRGARHRGATGARRHHPRPASADRGRSGRRVRSSTRAGCACATGFRSVPSVAPPRASTWPCCARPSTSTRRAWRSCIGSRNCSLRWRRSSAPRWRRSSWRSTTSRRRRRSSTPRTRPPRSATRGPARRR